MAQAGKHAPPALTEMTLCWIVLPVWQRIAELPASGIPNQVRKIHGNRALVGA